jgi:hypothetical protein
MAHDRGGEVPVRSFLIVNREAPVVAYVRNDEAGKTKRFKNWREFLDWYDEGFHGEMNMPPNSQQKFTDVLVDTLEDSKRGRRRKNNDADAAEPKRVSAKGKGTRILVDGKEHLGFEAVFRKVGWEFPSKRCRAFRGDLKAKKKLSVDGIEFELMEG